MVTRVQRPARGAPATQFGGGTVSERTRPEYGPALAGQRASLLGNFFILLWTPAILHSAGASPSQAILATTIYAVGIIASPLLAALIVNRIGIERVLACGLTLGALCVLAIGLFYPRSWLLSLILWGAGIGGGCQGGINSLSALAYPPAICSTGTGWASGVGRMGTIGAGLLGGALLALNLRTQTIFIAASIPAFGAALLMAILGRVRCNAVGSSDSNP